MANFNVAELLTTVSELIAIAPAANIGFSSPKAATGIITALLAQGYPPAAAATFGVYIHGAAGDKLATQKKYILAHEIAEEIPFYLNRQFL